MTFKDALHISSTNLLVKLALPDPAKYLTKHTRKVDLAFTELKVVIPYYPQGCPNCVRVIHTSYLEQQYMLEIVEVRRNGDKVGERHDLFSRLLNAAQGELGSEAALSDEELIGGYLNS